MINPKKSYTIFEYLEIMRRRIWYIVIPFVVITVFVLGYVLFAPRLYKATTLILVSPQRVPEAYVQATVTSKVEERLQSIAQEVMSRTRLESVINELHLFVQEKKRLSGEEIVELMRKNITVELPGKKEEKGAFTISYASRDPEEATTVTNRLASLFIEENLRIREQQATGTTEFLATELEMAKGQLDRMEAAVAQYKQRFMGQLPEQLEANLKMLEQLQNQYQRVGENLRAAQDRKLYIQKQLADFGMAAGATAGMPYKTPGLGPDSAVSAPDGMGAYDAQEEALRRYVDDLRSRYSETHPDVVAAKKRLADMEKKKNADGSSQESAAYKRDPRYIELKNQLTMTDLEIRRFRNEEANIAGQLAGYRSRIEQAPAREQDMAALMRQYASTKEAYEKLLQKSQEAQQAENLEKRQKGEQFRVIDPARTPENPFSPNIPKVLQIGLFAAVCCSFGMAYLREQMDRSFHDVDDAELALGLKVLATLPPIEKQLT